MVCAHKQKSVFHFTFYDEKHCGNKVHIGTPFQS